MHTNEELEADKLGIRNLAMCCRCHARFPVDHTGSHGPWCPECVQSENTRMLSFLFV